MPTFSGTLDPSAILIGLDPYTSANLFLERDYYTGDVLPANDTPGTDTASFDVVYRDQHDSVFAGSKSSEFFNDWYERIHIIPARIDLGNLVSSQSREVSVWNAFLTSQPYQDIEIAGADGITVTPPPGVVPPTTLKALQIVTYNVTIDISGPPIIDATITYTIDGVEYSTEIVGRRVVLMPFPPNWKAGVEELLQYRCGLTRSHDASEQVMAYRLKPRRQVSYQIAVSGVDAQRFDNLIYGWQSRLFGVPLWFETRKLLAPASAGDTMISLDTTNLSFTVGALLVIYRDATTYDVREIASITGNDVGLTAELSFDWGAGARVHPVMVGAVNSSLSGRRLTDGVIEIPLSFLSEPSSNLYPFEGGANPATYRGQELYTGKPNWNGGIEFQWESDGTSFDAGTGKYQLILVSGFSDQVREHSWLLKDYAEVAFFRSWMQRRLGRATPFWSPTHNTDFTLVAPVLIGANRLDVAANDYDLYAYNTNKRSDIFVRLRNGTTFSRRITGATREEGNIIALQIDSGVPQAFSPEDVVKISLLRFSRLAGDEVTLRWETSGVATVSTPLVTKKE